MNRKAWPALALGAAIAAAAGVAVIAQPTGNQAGAAGSGSGGASGGEVPAPPASETPPGVPVITPPPENETPAPAANAAATASAPVANPREASAPETNSAAKQAEAAPPPPPPAPPKPVRSPSAVLQALDKVTAETIRFSAPVGQPVRYKNLVFVVKACESTGLGGASPQASAYVVIDNAPLPSEGVTPPPPKQVFKGWMFSNTPELNPLQHPVYDAWLIACMAPTPPA